MADTEVIEYGGNLGLFAWRYPMMELSTWTQVQVGETQEVVLVKGGTAYDLLPPGHSVLNAETVPLVHQALNLPPHGLVPFAAEVWYVNKLLPLTVKWGTPVPIQLPDPKYGVLLSLQAYGSCTMRITDSRLFAAGLSGAVSLFDQRSLEGYFREVCLSKLKEALSSLLKQQISVFEMPAHLRELSTGLSELLAPAVQEYGLTLGECAVANLSIPEDNPTVEALQGVFVRKIGMDIAAPAPAPAPKAEKTTKPCPSCGAVIDGGYRFCPRCGSDTGIKDPAPVTCDRCGKAFPNDSLFCPHCGNRYRPCPNCGADVPDNAGQCPACGHSFNPPCPNCGMQSAEANPKFCPSCGEEFTKVKK